MYIYKIKSNLICRPAHRADRLTKLGGPGKEDQQLKKLE